MAGIKDTVDRIGKVRAEKKALEKEDKELKISLMQHIEKKKLKVTDTVVGNIFILTVKAKTKSHLNAKKIFKMLSTKDFFYCINVVKKRLVEILSAEEIDSCSTFEDDGLDFQVGKK